MIAVLQEICPTSSCTGPLHSSRLLLSQKSRCLFTSSDASRYHFELIMFLLDANQNDIRGIAEVQVSSWQTTYVGQVPQTYLDGLSVPKREVAWREELTIPSHRLIVAEENERIKGFVSFVHSRDTDVNSSVGEVYAIYLLETVKGPGHGRALWNDAFKALKADLYRQVTLWVVDTNTVARRSYERVGLV